MNNLNLTTAPAPSADQYPSVIFTEANAGSSTPACATSHGDTHLRTFDGLYYDFQASGDFVLADASPDFIVHTRQASGAPFWPKAAVNKAVAVQMGKTRAALYAEPTRLLIDGRPTDLAEGKTIKVGDIQLTRWRDDEYVFVSPTGDVVYAQINIVPKPAMTWIDVGVSMSSEHYAAARGLLGNPHGNAEELAAADGKVFHEPVSFDDLYHGYGESWRVRAEDSLFTEHSTIKPGIPDAPFYAEHLDPQEQARVRAICTGAGVTNEALLAACMLDTAVLGTNKAVKVFVNAAPPRHVIKPVVHPKP